MDRPEELARMHSHAWIAGLAAIPIAVGLGTLVRSLRRRRDAQNPPTQETLKRRLRLVLWITVPLLVLPAVVLAALVSLVFIDAR